MVTLRCYGTSLTEVCLRNAGLGFGQVVTRDYPGAAFRRADRRTGLRPLRAGSRYAWRPGNRDLAPFTRAVDSAGGRWNGNRLPSSQIATGVGVASSLPTPSWTCA
jgi:hypothetical protein